MGSSPQRYFIFQRWYHASYRFCRWFARVTVEPGRVQVSLAPWRVDFVHSESLIFVVRVRLWLGPGRRAFELVGPTGERAYVQPWNPQPLWNALDAAGFVLRERRAWWFSW